MGAALLLAAFATWYRMTHRPVRRAGLTVRAIPGARDSLRVEVLNAWSTIGLARVATWRLREGGIDVVYFGNDTTASLDSTEVLVRRGDEDAGARVGRALGVGRVRSAPDPSRLVDVTIRLGRDFSAATIGRDP